MIELKPVDMTNLWTLIGMELRPEQRGFVLSNVESIAEAYAVRASGGEAMPFAVCDGESVVGFCALGYGEIPHEPNPGIAAGNYCIRHLLIAAEHQGKGYGRAALRLALEYLRTRPCGEAEGCWIAFKPDNAAARALYLSEGFMPTAYRNYDEDVLFLPF